MNYISSLLIANNSVQRATVVTNTGIHFFYTVVENLTDVTMKFQPTNDLYSQLLYELNVSGISFCETLFN